MKEEELDKTIKSYFFEQGLPEQSIARILAAGEERKSQRSHWWRYWTPVAAAAAIMMAIGFQYGRSVDDSELFGDIAGKIAMRHNSYAKKNFGVEASSFEGVQSGLQDLAFSVTPLVKEKLLSAYEVMGARYCQLEGQQAAHLKVRNRVNGTICTLYIASLNGPLESLKETTGEVDLAANHVEMWTDTGRLFALVN